MTDEELKAIEERANAATQGPWECDRFPQPIGEDAAQVVSSDRRHDIAVGTRMLRARDAEFIAHARVDVPALVAEARRLRAALGAIDGELRSTDAHMDAGAVLRRVREHLG